MNHNNNSAVHLADMDEEVRFAKSKQQSVPSFPHGEIICTICNRVYSTGLVSADDVEKLSSISNPGIEVDGGWREGVLFLRIKGEIDNDDDDAEP